MIDSFSRCYKPPLSLTSSIYFLSCWQYFFRLAASRFSSFPYWTELQSKAIDKWEQNLELFHLLSTMGPCKPSNSMVAFRGGPKTDSWGVALIHRNATFCFRREKSRKTSAISHQVWGRGRERGGKISSTGVKPLSLFVLGWVLFWGGDFNPPNTPSSSRTPWKPKPSVRIISIHLASSQVVELFIKAPMPFNGCLEVVCWHFMAKGGKNRQ